MACQADEASVQGVCVQVPSNCAAVDALGLCARCLLPAQYRLLHGQCLLSESCAPNQYSADSGLCVNVTPGCTTFNPSSGVCLTCANGSPAQQGLCCPAGQSVLAGRCLNAATYASAVASSQGSARPTCIAFHPALGTCLACNANFQVDPTTGSSCI